ncbi:unnamed protein product [Phytophthora lilii]|uniref:Unnamed protein product n=1 Tax=Phytophthora lilii TaxID=2077276 RepID=A0A9W6WT69_9STRA|nr:unnamed protein product [Phytophthora lilii]GMF29227.1 unnamed protein product [Phytophthora lilii]
MALLPVLLISWYQRPEHGSSLTVFRLLLTEPPYKTNQVHEDVNTTFKAITETDYNTYVKHGPTSNFVLDKYATPTIQGSSGAAQSLENLATSSFMTA